MVISNLFSGKMEFQLLAQFHMLTETTPVVRPLGYGQESSLLRQILRYTFCKLNKLGAEGTASGGAALPPPTPQQSLYFKTTNGTLN